MEDSITEAILIIVRYLLQIYRMVRLLRTSKQLTRLYETEIIDLEADGIEVGEAEYRQT